MNTIGRSTGFGQLVDLVTGQRPDIVNQSLVMPAFGYCWLSVGY